MRKDIQSKLAEAFRSFANVAKKLLNKLLIHGIKTTYVTKETLGVGGMDGWMKRCVDQSNLTIGLNPRPIPAKNNCIR
jgi:hypothetical protein